MTRPLCGLALRVVTLAGDDVSPGCAGLGSNPGRATVAQPLLYETAASYSVVQSQQTVSPFRGPSPSELYARFVPPGLSHGIMRPRGLLGLRIDIIPG